MWRLVLIGCAILFGVFWTTNAAIMVATPKFWLRSPACSSFRGTVTERKYGNRNGHLMIRFIGAVCLTFSIGFIYDIISN